MRLPLCCHWYKARARKHAFESDFQQDVEKYNFRLAVLGSEKVGKSSLLRRLINKTFHENNYCATVEEHFELSLKFDDAEISLNIMDVGGCNELRDLQLKAIHESDAFLLVFSVTDYATFQNVMNIRDKIMAIKTSTPRKDESQYIPIVVVGNKQDLRRNREIPLREIKRVVENQWDCPYVEISIKYHINLLSVLSRLRDEVELSGLARAKILAEEANESLRTTAVYPL